MLNFNQMTEIFLVIVLIVVLILSYLERRDLHDRLMAKDLKDLKVNTQKDEPNQLEPEVENMFIPLEDAREDIEKDLNG